VCAWADAQLTAGVAVEQHRIAIAIWFTSRSVIASTRGGQTSTQSTPSQRSTSIVTVAGPPSHPEP
jgi:hypothetical protein